MKRSWFVTLSLLAGVPAAAQQEHPNLIFVITDQLRNDVFSCRGDEIARTPNIDRFKSESADFTNPLQQGLPCLPENIHPAQAW